jgi:hypothetical protein
MEPPPDARAGSVDLLATAEPPGDRRRWLWLAPVAALAIAALVHASGGESPSRPRPSAVASVASSPPTGLSDAAARGLPVDIELRQAVQEPARRTLRVTLVLFNVTNRPVVVQRIGASSGVARLESVRLGAGARPAPPAFVIRPAAALPVTLQFRVVDCASRAPALRLPVRLTTFVSGAVTGDVDDVLGPNRGRSLLSSLCPSAS